MPTVMISPEALIGVRGPWVEILEKAGFDIVYPEDTTFTRGHFSEEDTVRVLSGVSAVIAGGEVFSDPILAQLPNLRVIARQGVGYDRVDVAAATARGIPLTITPTANHEAVAEQGFAPLLAVAKDVVNNDAHTRAGRWAMKQTRQIRGQTLGIFGLGRIGRSMALRGLGMRMKVIATDEYPHEQFLNENDIRLVDFEQLLAESDFLSIHCPLNEQTQGMFNAEVFAKMKPGSVLINTARGKLVVEKDLIQALNDNHLAGAGLDVFEVEPTSADNPLFQLENVVCSPHVAGAEKLAQTDMAIEAATCVVKLYQGEWPAGAVVNDQLRNGWSWN